MRVFIADDSAVLRERLIEMLSEMKKVEVVGQAGDAIEAQESIIKLKPDLVILDIRMPSGSGIDVLQNIKEAGLTPKVIIFTNYPYPQYRKKCKALGVDFFFDKSSEFEKFTEVLKKLVSKSSNNRKT